GGYTLIKEEDGVITIGIEKEEDYVEGWQDAYIRIDTNEDKSSVTLHTHWGAADYDVVLSGGGSLTFNGKKFMTEQDIADEEKQWLAVGNYLTDPQVPRTALRPASGTPKVGDIMYGAGLDGLFLCAEITGVSTTGGETLYDYTYLN
ncbi:MAG: hypothetical protein LUD72_00850, partial [Bacteroidales bacterium]|nr:hypothetical protein [Bacteroidales bacterium]